MNDALAELSPSRLAEVVRQHLLVSEAKLSALWVRVSTNRNVYAAELRRDLTGQPVVVVVVRDVRFDNANALTNDLIELLERNRDVCEATFAHCPRGLQSFGVVLVGRTELPTVGFSSPVSLPQWFPVFAGQQIFASVSDVNYTAAAPLDAEEARLPDLRGRLYALEVALVRRLKLVHTAAHSKSAHLNELVRRQPEEHFRDMLDQAEAHLAGVEAPLAYRPSLKAGASLAARLWDVVQTTPPASLGKPAKALGRALSLGEAIEVPWHSAYLGVLSRPTDRDVNEAQRFSRGLLTSLASTCQLVTASAHADQYPSYPVVLLRAMSVELRACLGDATAVLYSATDP